MENRYQKDNSKDFTDTKKRPGEASICRIIAAYADMRALQVAKKDNEHQSDLRSLGLMVTWSKEKKNGSEDRARKHATPIGTKRGPHATRSNGRHIVHMLRLTL